MSGLKERKGKEVKTTLDREACFFSLCVPVMGVFMGWKDEN
jgi:hypothetical protein